MAQKCTANSASGSNKLDFTTQKGKLPRPSAVFYDVSSLLRSVALPVDVDAAEAAVGPHTNDPVAGGGAIDHTTFVIAGFIGPALIVAGRRITAGAQI